MHRHPSNPKELLVLLPEFSKGEFVLKRGWGINTDVYNGKVAELQVPNLSVRKLRIYPAILYSRRIGCDAQDSAVNRWDRVEPIPEYLDFDFTWFYRQPRHERLKLEFVIKEEGKKSIFFSRAVTTTDRCWLCSRFDPMYPDLFRNMLLEMFIKESREKESRWKQLRNRLLS